MALKDENMPAKFLQDLQTPAVIKEMLRMTGRARAETRQRFEQDLKLSYYFGGMDVACAETAKGLAIVASGPGAEVNQVLSRLGKKEQSKITILFPETWEETIENFCERPSLPK
jgi:2-hydroxy-3-keto-5-methylthiopentenyl-1-phosphate phosphatase